MKFDFTKVAPQLEEKTWKETIIDRIVEGKVVPIISNSFTNDLAFGSHDDLVEGWASYIQYPLADQHHDLPRMAQYESVRQSNGQVGDVAQIKEKYLKFLKAALFLMADQDPDIPDNLQVELREQAGELTVSEMSRRLNYPNLAAEPPSPLLLLAALPLPIYLTTSYHDYLGVALKKAAKEPHSEICHWHEGLQSIVSVFERDKNYEPTPKRPLVYHLHGFDRYPESLVLTEDDYLDFLANISKDPEAIHPRVRRALTESSLLMLGYRLHDWDFKVLFRGLIKTRPPSLWRTSVLIQLEKSPSGAEETYIRQYLRQMKFEVEWTDPHSFIQELYEQWGGS